MSGHPSHLLTRRTVLHLVDAAAPAPKFDRPSISQSASKPNFVGDQAPLSGAVTPFAQRHTRAREAAVERVAHGELDDQAEIPLELSPYNPLIDVRPE